MMFQTDNLDTLSKHMYRLLPDELSAEIMKLSKEMDHKTGYQTITWLLNEALLHINEG